MGEENNNRNWKQKKKITTKGENNVFRLEEMRYMDEKQISPEVPRWKAKEKE